MHRSAFPSKARKGFRYLIVLRVLGNVNASSGENNTLLVPEGSHLHLRAADIFYFQDLGVLMPIVHILLLVKNLKPNYTHSKHLSHIREVSRLFDGVIQVAFQRTLHHGSRE